MIIILTILLILLVMILLIFVLSAKVILAADINETETKMKVTLNWLAPFFVAEVTFANSRQLLEVHLLGIRIIKHQLPVKKKKIINNRPNRLELLRSVHLTEVEVRAEYGFLSPFATGMICGFLGTILQYIGIDSLEQKPDFTADDDFIHIYATGILNIGLTLVNLIKAYSSNTNSSLSYGTEGG